MESSCMLAICFYIYTFCICPVFSRVHVAYTLAFCVTVCFVDPIVCLFALFVCPLIYGFWLPQWYLQTFLGTSEGHGSFRRAAQFVPARRIGGNLSIFELSGYNTENLTVDHTIVGKEFWECRAPFVDFEKEWTHCNRYKFVVPAHLSIHFLLQSIVVYPFGAYLPLLLCSCYRLLNLFSSIAEILLIGR